MIRHKENITRRSLLKGALRVGLASLAAPLAGAAGGQPAAESWDFTKRGIEGWTTVTGSWAVEDIPGASGGGRVLVQREKKNTFNVIVAPLGPYSDVDVSVKFKPISGKEDASGGIVFRFVDGKYYLVRANALEDNFRFYYYDGGRRMLASARVQAPALGQWHAVRVAAAGDRVQAWLDGALLLDYRDQRFRAGSIGLWTKADSVTAFDELIVRGARAAG